MLGENYQSSSMNLVKLQDKKTNPWKSLAFLYDNKRSETEIMETIPLTITTKRIKYLGIYYPRRQKICTLKTL